MEHTDAPTWTLASTLGRGGRARRAGVVNTPAAQHPWGRWAPWVLAGVAFAMLMFSFLSVLRQAVERGERQRQQVRQQASAEQQCRNQATPALRRHCGAELAADRALASLR